MARPSVVLPEPDSPTTPTVSPARTRTETPSTRLDVAGDAPEQAGAEREPHLHRPGLDQGLGRGRDRVGAALRLGGEQAAGVVVLRVGKNLGDRAGLDDAPPEHDADPVGDPPHHAEVVGDEQHRHAEAAPQVGEQVEDLGLDGDVEGRGRLVGDEQVGLAGERHRDHHPLALPPDNSCG